MSLVVIMASDATEEQVQAVVKQIEKTGLAVRVVPGTSRTVIGVSGNYNPEDTAWIESLPGVLNTLRVSQPYRLVSREQHPENTVIELEGVSIGGPEVVIAAGPCAVESQKQLLLSAERAKEAGVHLLRGGAFKPRTSPYSFQGLGENGMRLLAEARRLTGLPVVSEAVDEESAELAARYCDVVQIGTRNMQNYVLLRRVARYGKPVLLKRGVAATLEEFLGAAEYILAEGNSQVILCERGVRTFSDYTRHTLDVSIVPAIKAVSHLPIITDPSHAAGRRDLVIPLACASVAAGADGVMVEFHPDPEQALSDGFQSLFAAQLDELMTRLRRVANAVGREFPEHTRRQP